MSESPTSLSPNRRSSPAARWAQETFSRESFFSAIKTLLWLVPLTLLIWIYAERSQVVPLVGETIPIEVRSSDPNLFSVKLMVPAEGNVIGDLQGSQARIEQVSKNIAPVNNNPSVVLTIPVSQPGVIELDTATQLSLNSTFSGVSVSNCKPQRLKILIDKMDEAEAEVKVRPDQENQIASYVFTPRTVKLRGSQMDIASIKAQGPLIVYVDIDKSVLQTPGTHDDLIVRFQSDQFKGKPIAFSTTTVKASIEVRQSEYRGTVQSIPIQYLIPPAISNDYRIQITGGITALANVPVIGPEEKVKELENATKLEAIAVLPIKFGTDEQSAVPEIHLPDPSVRVDTSYTPKEITYTLKKRDQP